VTPRNLKLEASSEEKKIHDKRSEEDEWRSILEERRRDKFI